MKQPWRLQFMVVILISMLLNSIGVYAQQSLLEEISEQGEVRVGTTGDYKPFSFWNSETETYEGLDIDAAHMLADALGVNVSFVPTSWQNLSEGILTNRYDIAMSGITRTLARQQIVAMTDPYMDVGKVLIIRDEDIGRLQSLEDINREEVLTS